MNKILDLAQDFNQKSEQQANDIERSGKAALQQLEKSWQQELRRSEITLKNAIQEHQSKTSKMILRSWAAMAIVIVSMLAISIPTLIWLGVELKEKNSQILIAKETLQKLGKRGGIMILSTCTEAEWPCFKVTEVFKDQSGNQWAIPERKY